MCSIYIGMYVDVLFCPQLVTKSPCPLIDGPSEQYNQPTMSRHRLIDDFPEPTTKPKMKVVVLSCSRTATLGLWNAFKILGFRPYHAAEMVLNAGRDHMQVFYEAMLAENDKWSGIEPYGRAEFDKWLKDYDVVMELISNIPEQTINAYLGDANVKFLLTERDPDAWVKSYNSFIGGLSDAMGALPLSVLKYFQADLWHLSRYSIRAYGLFSGSRRPSDPETPAVLRRHYVEYIDMVKTRVPADRLAVIKLEDGLGWEQLCSVLGVPVPDVPYPEGTDHRGTAKKHIQGLVHTAMARMAAMVVPTLAAGGWLAWRVLASGNVSGRLPSIWI